MTFWHDWVYNKGRPWKSAGIGTMPLGNWQWKVLKLATICRSTLKGEVCMSHQFVTTCMGLHIHKKEGKQRFYKKKSCIIEIHEKIAID